MNRRAAGASPGQEADLAAALGHAFADPELLRAALTHPSAGGRAAAAEFQRMEFLGDRVLGLVIADLLLKRFPGEQEGSLAKRYAALVKRDTLVDVAREIGLDAHLRSARGDEGAEDRDAPTILGDSCEAVIAALYLDGGFKAAAQFIEKAWNKRLMADVKPPQDSKTALQEWAQGAGRPLPVYRTVTVEGPSHAPQFSIEVEVEGFTPVVGQGTSKRAAEQEAAAGLLKNVMPGHER